MVDECHLNFHATVKMDLLTNVPHNLYCSATFGQTNKYAAKIFDVIYPKAIRYGEDAYDKYVEGVGTILPTPLQEGLKFDGWYATETFEGNSAQRIDASATGDKSFYAKWTDTTLISSSSTDIESSSSSEQTTRLAKRMTKSFNLSTQGRRLAVTGAGAGIVRIFDSLGHLVAEQELSGGNANFVLNNNGRYVVKLNGNQKGFNIH